MMDWSCYKDQRAHRMLHRPTARHAHSVSTCWRFCLCFLGLVVFLLQVRGTFCRQFVVDLLQAEVRRCEQLRMCLNYHLVVHDWYLGKSWARELCRRPSWHRQRNIWNGHGRILQRQIRLVARITLLDAGDREEERKWPNIRRG